MTNLEKMSKEHEELFPNATPESQFFKLEEEILEFALAETATQTIKEVADIWIVCAGLYRWFPRTALAVIGNFKDALRWEWRLVLEEVERKWEVNKSRTWVWNGKTYKHVGKDGNE